MDTPSEKNDPLETYKPSRREAIKLLTAAGAGALVGGSAKEASAASGEGVSSQTFSLFKKEYESIDHMYDISKEIQRFDQKNTALIRGIWDKSVQPSTVSFGVKKSGLIPFAQEGTPGYSKVDWALHWAAMSGTNTCAPMSTLGVRGAGIYNDWNRHANPKFKRQIFEDKAEISKKVKRAAKFLGASLVGIAPYDERWTYRKWFDVDPSFEETRSMEIQHDLMREVEGVFPFEPKSVIALAFEMDYNALQAPGFISGAAPALAYSDMPEVAFKVAEFLNLLGYKSIPAGNDTGMSVPIAVQAGLGELSRMGLLITKEYGPRVRLAKVYTDLELVYDKPTGFGVWEFCKRCQKCAEICPSRAINIDVEPTVKSTTGSKSNNPGVKKWFQRQERCMLQFDRNGGTGCSYCITACPYNKLDTWVHDTAKLLTGLPVGRDIARQLDDAFGYGKKTAEAAEAFWNKDV